MSDAAAHARLAPSGAAIWANCPGSVAMQEAQPEQEETDESREGDAAHWLLKLTLRNVTVPDDTIAPNGVPINDEMREAIKDLVVDVTDTLKTCAPGDVFYNEHHVAAHYFIHPDNDGTPDAHFVQRSRKTIHIWDFKYGHRFVDVFQCLQLINYAAAIVESEQIGDWRDWAFTFTIAQPRCYVRDELGGPLREWFTTGAALEPWFEKLRAAAVAASQPDAPCVTGEHCRDCRAAWDCEANQRAGGAVIDLVHGQHTAGMDARAIGLNAKMLAYALKRGEAILNSLEARALALLDQGENVPWHRVEFSKPRTVWDKAKQAEAARFVEMFGVPVEPGVALPTPSECVKRGVDETVIKPYTTKAPAAKKLVRYDDTRAEKIFGRR